MNCTSVDGRITDLHSVWLAFVLVLDWAAHHRSLSWTDLS